MNYSKHRSLSSYVPNPLFALSSRSVPVSRRAPCYSYIHSTLGMPGAPHCCVPSCHPEVPPCPSLNTMARCPGSGEIISEIMIPLAAACSTPVATLIGATLADSGGSDSSDSESEENGPGLLSPLWKKPAAALTLMKPAEQSNIDCVPPQPNGDYRHRVSGSVEVTCPKCRIRFEMRTCIILEVRRLP